MKYRQAQRAARAADQALDLRQGVTLDSLHATISAQRNRSIVIDELSTLSGRDVCGVWVALDDEDLILHAPTRSSLHRQQIILHEFSHMILQHDVDAPDVVLSPDLLADLLLGLPPGRVHKVLHRDSFNDEVELTTELLADRLAARIMRGNGEDQREHLSFGEVFG